MRTNARRLLASLAGVAGAVAARNLDDRISADQAKLAAALTQINGSITKLSSSTQNASATLHTTGGPETIDRIIDVFPPHQQQ